MSCHANELMPDQLKSAERAVSSRHLQFGRERAHLETTTKVRRKRAPVAELESSANPQPGKAALRSARFPACGFWRLSSRQMVGLSRSSLCWKVGFHKSYSPGLGTVLVSRASTHEPWFWI